MAASRLWTIVAGITLAFGVAYMTHAAPAKAPAVETTVEGEMLKLRSGEELLLADILLPPPDTEAGKHSRARLASLVRGQALILQGGWRDRYGRMLGYLELPGGTYVQNELVASGLALVAPTPQSDKKRLPSLLAAERGARQARQGLWKWPDYAIVLHTEAKHHLNEFRLVEGVVREVAFRKNTTYINFDDDWQTDFTLAIEGRDRRAFKKAFLQSLTGKRVRARGWLHPRGGPMIDLFHPAQLEVLG